MLAGETAAGAYPARAVQTLDAIIRDAEGMPPLDVRTRARGSDPRRPRAGACEAAVTLADHGEGAGDRRGDPRRHDGAASVGASAAAPITSRHRESADGADGSRCTGCRPVCASRSATTSTPPARGSGAAGPSRPDRRAPGGVREHQRRSHASRRKLPEDSAHLMPDIATRRSWLVVIAFVIAPSPCASRSTLITGFSARSRSSARRNRCRRSDARAQ